MILFHSYFRARGMDGAAEQNFIFLSNCKDFQAPAIKVKTLLNNYKKSLAYYFLLNKKVRIFV